MKNNDLIKVWKEGNFEMLKNRKFEKSELTLFLKSKARKAALPLNLNILTYIVVLLAVVVLIGFDIYEYRSNPIMLKVLIPILISCSVFLGYGVFLLNYIRQISSNELDITSAINRKLKLYTTHYEVWMWIGAISCLFLIFTLGALIDSDQGTYRINRPIFFAVVSFLIICFIYGAQKAAQFVAVRSIKIYLADLKNDTLEGSHRLLEMKRRYKIFTLILVIILTIMFIWGIIRAMGT